MRTVVLKSVVKKSVLCLSLAALMPFTAYADKTDDILNSGIKRQGSGAASQKRIDAISEQTEKVIADYHQQRKNVEVLKKFNDRMRRTLQAQEVAMQRLERSIEDASLIERQIVPLMLSMIDGLERFIAADVPFKLEERRARVGRIKGYLTNANISAAERFRQVLEAYSIENAYGQSIDVFVEELELPQGTLSVNMLQVGRSGLYYLTTDGKQAGYWDTSAKVWKALDSSHNAGIAQAIRMTQDKEVKGLMLLPTKAPEAI
ncbi:DUF3450 domain-containing protein [Arenicella xantha]|uniref:Uncharacterized protein DUF3450 n=1 Tax=Arenicella xantha TaxID=644221 RepID=A0A395JNB0_9GAMM|nr:DUF3450 domain-containing protein [Arenicella xantha]RBP53154.1 uncharacterized protein DUF3450 [Arenicella xantha]